MPHVLLVDDDAIEAAVYSRLLALRSFTAESALDASAALTAFTARRPDAVLLDLVPDDEHAISFIRAVRADTRGPRVPVFVLANAFLEMESLAAWEAGADRVLGRASHSPGQVLDLVATAAGLTVAAQPAYAPQAVRAEFRARAAHHVQAGRTALRGVLSADSPGESLEDLGTAMRRLQVAQTAGVPGIAGIAGAAEWLSRALVAWPSSIGPSSLRTLEQALDRIERCLGQTDAKSVDPAECRVLAVDDDPTSRLLLQQSFRKVKVPCDVFADPADALAAAAAKRYDLVVSDVMMPGMDGFEMVARLRRLPGFATVPVIYVTALDSFVATFARDPHGGTDAIVKPYLIMELASKGMTHLVSPA